MVHLRRHDPVHGYFRLFRPAKKQIKAEQNFDQDVLYTIRRHGQMRFTVGGSSPDSTSLTAASTTHLERGRFFDFADSNSTCGAQVCTTPKRGPDISVFRIGEEGRQTRLLGVSLTDQARHKKNSSLNVNFVFFSETIERSGTIQHMQHVSQNSKHWLNLFLSHVVLDPSGLTTCDFIAVKHDPEPLSRDLLQAHSLLHSLPFADFFKPTNSHVRPRSSSSRSQI